MKRWIVWLLALVLLIPGLAWGAPPIGETLQAWMDQTDSRLADLEARVAALESGTTTTTTIGSPSTTTPSTTTTAPPSTTTTSTLPATTTTVPATTSTTLPPTTTTQPSTTTTTSPSTPPETISLSSDWLITGTDTRSNLIIEANGFEVECRGCALNWTDVKLRGASRLMMHMGAKPSLLRRVDIIDGGVEGVTGFYAFHMHLNGTSAFGTLLDDVQIINSRNRGFVVHGTDGVTLQDSGCFNIVGECIWWDSPGTNDPDGCGGGSVCDFIDNSNDFTAVGVVCDGVRPPSGSAGHRMSCFKLGAGERTAIRNSIARNVSGGRDCSGFHWPEFGDGHGRGQPLTWVFENNFAFNPDPDCHGIFVWQNDDQDHVVTTFEGDGIGHGAYVNIYHYEGFNVPYVEAHAAGWSMANGHIGVFTALRHRNLASPTVEFTNVTFDRFVVNNATNGGDVRGIYVINGTNLTCGDIEYSNVVSGTEVIIDGLEC